MTTSTDTTAPSKPSITSIAGDGTLTKSELANWSIVGTAEAGSTITLAIDGDTMTPPTTVTDSSGNWTITGNDLELTELSDLTTSEGNQLPNGDYTFSVTAKDASGNISEKATGTLKLDVDRSTDTTAPSKPSITSIAGDGTLTKSELANWSIVGTAEAGSTITLAIDGDTMTPPTTVTDSSGNWTITGNDLELTELSDLTTSEGNQLPNGDYTFSVTAKDASGNISEKATGTLKLDVDRSTDTTEKDVSTHVSTALSERLVSTLQKADKFKFSKIKGLQGDDVIVNFSYSKDSIEFEGYDPSKITTTLDSSGYDHFIFDEDNGESSVRIENDTVASSLKLKNLSGKTLKIDSSEYTVDQGGVFDIATTTSVSTVNVDGMTSFKTSIKKVSDDNASDPINLSDVLAQLKHIVGLKELKANALQAGDTNNDGTVNLSDVLGNLKHIVGLKEIDSFDLVTDNGFAINSLNPDSNGNLTLVINGDADQSHADWDFV